MFSYGENNIVDFSNIHGTNGLFAANASGKSTPEFACGQNSFRISSSKVYSRAAIDKASAAEAAFFSQGTEFTASQSKGSVGCVSFL